MRYLTVDNINFTDINDNTWKVKDMREYPTYNLLTKAKLKEDDFFDEIITRQELYGTKNEDLSYAIIDINREKLTENDFNLSKLNEISIPVIE